MMIATRVLTITDYRSLFLKYIDITPELRELKDEKAKRYYIYIRDTTET